MTSDRYSHVKTKYKNLIEDTSKKYKGLRFPLDYGKYSNQWLIFSEYSYGRPSADDRFKPVATGSTISLPIPGNLETYYTASWNDENLGYTGDFVARKIAGIGSTASQITRSSSESFFDNPGNYLKSHLDSIKKGFSSDGGPLDIGAKMGIDAVASSSAFSRVGVYAGKLRNPYTAAIFTGVPFRRFIFEYKFFPKSFEESEVLDEIIFILKRAMHPSITQKYEDNLWDYPNIYRLNFTEDEYLFNFGFCVISEFRVNYHGEGIPVYFNKDGKKIPSSISMTIGLMEIELNTKETIDQGR